MKTLKNNILLPFLLCICLIGCLSLDTTLYVGITDYLDNPSTILPPVQTTDSVVPEIEELHNENGGSTYSLRWGNLSGDALFVVSIYPDLGQTFKGKQIQADILRNFIDQNQTLLKDPRCTVGTWYDADDKETYLDISAVFSDLDTAIKLAKQYNQISIWDLKNSKDIETGGTGDPPEKMPEIDDRLPPLL